MCRDGVGWCDAHGRRYRYVWCDAHGRHYGPFASGSTQAFLAHALHSMGVYSTDMCSMVMYSTAVAASGRPSTKIRAGLLVEIHVRVGCWVLGVRC